MNGIVFLSFLTTSRSDVPLFTEEWRWSHFSTESGLPSNQIDEMYEATDGVLWIVSQREVSWFNGFKWIPAYHIPAGSSPPTNIIGEWSGGILVHSFDVNLVSRISSPRCVLPADTGRAGFLWYPTAIRDKSVLLLGGTTLYLFENGKTSPYRDPTLPESARFTEIFSHRNKLWAYSTGGLHRYNKDKGWILMIPTGERILAHSGVAENESGTGLTVFTLPLERRGLWEWEKDSPPRINPHEGVGGIRSLDVAPDGDALIVYESGDVRMRRKGQWGSVALPAEVHDIQTVWFQSNNDIWFGTGHGLYVYRRSTPRWNYVRHEGQDSRNNVNEIFFSQNGDLWTGTSDGVEVRTTDGGYRHYSRAGNTPLGSVTGINEDAEGLIWISSGSSFSGAFAWNGKSWRHDSVAQTRAAPFFHKIRKDNEGKLWFLGLGRFPPKIDSAQPGAFVYSEGTFSQWEAGKDLPTRRVYAFAQDSEGSLWFGTSASLSRYKAGTWKHFTSFHGQPFKVFTLAIDAKNRVWCGSNKSEELGLLCVDTDGTIRRYLVTDGLLHDQVWDVRVDDRGGILVATAGGVNYVRDGSLLSIDRTIGLPASLIWPVLPRGDSLLIGTLGQGLAILYNYSGIPPPPEIAILPAAISEQTATIRWEILPFGGARFRSAILSRHRINASPWSDWNLRHEVFYSNLDPGSHTLHVQAKGVQGEYSTQGTMAQFSIPPPLIRQPLFMYSVGLLLTSVAALVLIFQIRRRSYVRSLRESEQRFRSATQHTSSAIFIIAGNRIIFANHAAQTLTGATEEELFGKTVGDFFHLNELDELTPRGRDDSVSRRSDCRIKVVGGGDRWVDLTVGAIRFEGLPVTFVTAFDITERKQAESQLQRLTAELILTEERERRRIAMYLHDSISQALVLSKQKLDNLDGDESSFNSKSLDEVRMLIQQSIDSSRSLTFELCPPILYDLGLIYAIDWLIEQMKKSHTLTVHFAADRSPLPLADEIRNTMYMGVREALVNVVKHAEARNIWVEVYRWDHRIEISIEDDGKGIVREGPVGGSLAGSQNGGFGFINLQQRLNYLGGALEIESGRGKGTRVTLSAPLPEEGA